MCYCVVHFLPFHLHSVHHSPACQCHEIASQGRRCCNISICCCNRVYLLYLSYRISINLLFFFPSQPRPRRISFSATIILNKVHQIHVSTVGNPEKTQCKRRRRRATRETSRAHCMYVCVDKHIDAHLLAYNRTKRSRR